MSHHEAWMRRCIELASESASSGGGPFGAFVVRGEELVARGTNLVTALRDPTAHAEVQAIRAACAAVGDYRLSGCELYASTEPCPMCLAACYWARLDAVYYGATRWDAAKAGFDDARLYAELGRADEARTLPTRHVAAAEAAKPFEVWSSNASRQEY
jgi:guanine deaminase